MQRPHHLLLLRLLLVGALLAAAVVAGSGLAPESCSSQLLAFHINILPDPVPAASRSGASCEAVRSGVESSLAATGGVVPCLCLLDDWSDFLFTGICIEDVIPMVYVPCGGQRAEEARLLAARCDGMTSLRSPSPRKKEKYSAVVRPVEPFSTNQ